MKARASRGGRAARGMTWLALALMTALAACGRGTSETPPARESPLPQATPYAQEPAAGICGQVQGGQVTMTLEPGIPDPRCMVVAPAQHLRVVNHTGGDVMVGLGPFSASLASGAETVFNRPFADYLMPGVHVLQVDPCCGGELWLKE